MAKIRIYDLAKELSVSPMDVLDLLHSIGVKNKVASSSVEETDACLVREKMSPHKHGTEVGIDEVLKAMRDKMSAHKPGHFDSIVKNLNSVWSSVAELGHELRLKELMDRKEAKMLQQIQEQDLIFRQQIKRGMEELKKSEEKIAFLEAEVENFKKHSVPPFSWRESPDDVAYRIVTEIYPYCKPACDALKSAARNLKAHQTRLCLIDCSNCLENALEEWLKCLSRAVPDSISQRLNDLIALGLISNDLKRMIYNLVITLRNDSTHKGNAPIDLQAAQLAFFSTCIVFDSIAHSVKKAGRQSHQC